MRGRSPDSAYLTMKNTQGIATGKYNGTWTDSQIKIDGTHLEFHTDIAIHAINVPVKIEVTREEIKIYLP